MSKGTRWSLTEYERHLPEGVFLKWSPSSKSFSIVSKTQGNLAKRDIETVLMWHHPDKVFGYIARRLLFKRLP